MTLDLIVNGVVAVLLVVTIGVATMLSIRLRRMRGARADMEALVGQLAAAGAGAESSLRELRETADGVGRDLEEQVRSGLSLREELTFLIDRSSAIADRLAEMPAAPTPVPAHDARSDGLRRSVPTGSRPAKLVQAIRPRSRAANSARDSATGPIAPDAAIVHKPGDAEQALMRALESAR